MFLMRNPPNGANDNQIINIQYSYYYGSNWQECGVSRADGFLTALGFSTPNEVVKFLSVHNAFEVFSKDGWVQNYLSGNEKQEVAKGRNPRVQKSFIPPNPLIGNSSMTPAFELKSSYDDFFQFLFSWLTGGSSLEERGKFINFWEDSVRPPKNRYVIANGSAPCLKSFKDLVDAFLNELRNPRKTPVAESESWLVNVAESIKNRIISKVLTKSKWSYISGLSAAGSVSIGKFLSIGGGGGSFAVFDNDEKEKLYPLRIGGANFGTGAGAALPVNITIDPEEFPSKGTIYHGLAGSVLGVHSFLGAYVAISAGAALYLFNQTSSLMFIAPFYALPVMPIQGNDQAARFASVIPLSHSILALDGHGIEVGIGVSGQVSFGYVGPGREK